LNIDILMNFPIIIIVILCIIIVLKRRGLNNSKNRTSDDSHKCINMSDYNNYIFMSNSTEDYLIKQINSFDFELNDEGARLEYKINDKGYIFIKCFEDITFYDYQNFATWLLGLESYDDKPDLTVAISLHKFDDRLSYYGILDNDSDGDKVIGVFNNGDRFSIYLPDCFHDNKNIKNEYNDLLIVGVKEYMNSLGVDIDCLIKDLESYSKYININ